MTKMIIIAFTILAYFNLSFAAAIQCPAPIFLNAADVEESEVALIRALGYAPTLSEKRYTEESEYLKVVEGGEFALVFDRGLFHETVLAAEDNMGLRLYYKYEDGLKLVYQIGDGLRKTNEAFIDNLPKCSEVDLVNIPQKNSLFDLF